jgi:hypothetical protein
VPPPYSYVERRLVKSTRPKKEEARKPEPAVGPPRLLRSGPPRDGLKLLNCAYQPVALWHACSRTDARCTPLLLLLTYHIRSSAMFAGDLTRNFNFGILTQSPIFLHGQDEMGTIADAISEASQLLSPVDHDWPFFLVTGERVEGFVDQAIFSLIIRPH